MNEEKEIAVGVLSDDDGNHVIALKVGDEQVILELEEAGELFDVLGDALDVAGFFDDEEDGSTVREAAPTCH